MAPSIGTGMGITEASGFCTYVQANATEHEEILASLGQDMPIYPCSIRKPMQEDGNAGAELATGEIGHICFRGPQTFLGYVNDPDATAKTISRDGYLYTGDLGFKDGAGLHLTGRAKWVIKSMGYQIFPGDVEAHVCSLSAKVANCVVVGVAHEVVTEAVVAVVEKQPGVELTLPELDKHARSLTAYMRPRHWVLLEPGKMPLNRIAKPDYFRAQELARNEIAALRARGEWDTPGAGKPQRTGK
jgi:acyl-CoA synthetase (AMP-forming)/AMP-acid ligase II